MKRSHILIPLLIGASISAGPSPAFAQDLDPADQPTIITPPAVQNGSNASRAPFPARRQFDDVRPPDGRPIDRLPPNTPATNSEPPPPEPVVAIFQREPAPDIDIGAEPALLPTGRPTVALAATLDATHVSASIRSAPLNSRERILADVQTRLNAAESSVAALRDDAPRMTAANRRAFNAAAATIDDRADALKKSIADARKAAADDWPQARAQLAADYEAYAAAVAQVDHNRAAAPTAR